MCTDVRCHFLPCPIGSMRRIPLDLMKRLGGRFSLKELWTVKARGRTVSLYRPSIYIQTHNETSSYILGSSLTSSFPFSYEPSVIGLKIVTIKSLLDFFPRLKL